MTTTNERNYDDDEDDEYENENEGGAADNYETDKKWILKNSTIVYREKASER
eukprot:CAMPEP_0170966752 /NCGR_PEP_ID=MMETSP0735-20130129/42030_1 /TAXON_ID=186038 /ORGANISM="Fragilariopsis kerguelensis, Strain L26-C5" /LENGTH=51 /DNA_ID=CAMNT_0011385011 /DNA_START=26 /DNA_END=177 /DNA_ORIENTATION=-